jgi:hypothetical protein
MATDDIWFKPKSHGYGMEPANWKGWLVTAIYCAATIALALMTGESAAQWLAFLTGCLAATWGFVLIARLKSNGDLRWRWHSKADDGQ